MAGKPLPVLNFAPFRKYPAKLANQEYVDERQVCGNCLSGACCTTEDPIYLTSFDVFRLAAFFDLSPAEFLLRFTQDSFDSEDSELTRRLWIDDPESSKVTYLRRRANTPVSPCIFLKYIREPDGTPRRICSVHDARPLSCREFYFEHCKTRGTGEMASLLAEGFEMVRDGEITKELVAERLASFGGHDPSVARVAESLEYTFWVEMKRVFETEQANLEGSNSYRMADYQDPIDEKLNRVLSAKYLRFEESYGPKPNGEQLMPYTSGLSFVASPERARIMKLLRNRPASGLFQHGDFPFHVAMRTMVSGVQQAELFTTISNEAAVQFLSGIAPYPLFPDHTLPEVRSITERDVAAAMLRGFNHLICYSSYLATMGDLLEGEPPGLLEMNLLEMFAGFETNTIYTAHISNFQPIKQYLAGQTIGLLEDLLHAARKPSDDFAIHRTLCRLRPVLSHLSPELHKRFESVAVVVRQKLKRDNLKLYVHADNPIATRQALGKRLNAPGAWAEWERQTLDMRYAQMAGFEGLNLPAYYRRSIDELEKIPFKKSYGAELFRIMSSLSRSMSFDNPETSAGQPATQSAVRLASYGGRLFEWMDEVWGHGNLDIEIIAGFSALLFNGAAAGNGLDHTTGLILHQLLRSQMPDGSWGTNPPASDVEEWQGDYLYKMHSATCACLEGLRVSLKGRLHADNATP